MRPSTPLLGDERRSPAPGVVPFARFFDLDDVRPGVGQCLGAVRAGEDPRQVDHAHAFEGSSHGYERRERRDSLPTRARGFKGARRSAPLLNDAQYGPARMRVRSKTRMPDNGPDMSCPFGVCGKSKGTVGGRRGKVKGGRRARQPRCFAGIRSVTPAAVDGPRRSARSRTREEEGVCRSRLSPPQTT